MDKISIVIPCYNEEQMVPLYYNEMQKIQKKIENVKFEYIFVNDGSTDKTLYEIKKISVRDNNVKYISFSRNFGKEAAMYAGLKNSNGDFVVVMDVDLQDPPELLIEMYNIIKEKDIDCIATRRKTRKGEPKLRSLFSKIFYKIINKMSDVKIVDGARDYRMMKRKMVQEILKVTEYNRFSKGIFEFVGFNKIWIEYDNVERKEGKTKWSFIKLFKYSIEGITAFSTTPLVISALIGIIFCIISFVMILVIIIKTLVYGNATSGWPSLVCIIFMISGIQLFSLGIIGEYLSKTYLETKNRPIYIVKEDNLLNDKKEIK